MTRSDHMPETVAPTGSSATARMALPMGVLVTMNQRIPKRTIEAERIRIWMGVMTAPAI